MISTRKLQEAQDLPARNSSSPHHNTPTRPLNHHRGEIEAVFDGEPMRLVLTLGALAELESAFNVTDLISLSERFAGGKFSAKDILAIIVAGLRGAGHDVSNAQVAKMRVEGGVGAFAAIAADLLSASFAGNEEASQNP